MAADATRAEAGHPVEIYGVRRYLARNSDGSLGPRFVDAPAGEKAAIRNRPHASPAGAPRERAGLVEEVLAQEVEPLMAAAQKLANGLENAQTTFAFTRAAHVTLTRGAHGTEVCRSVADRLKSEFKLEHVTIQPEAPPPDELVTVRVSRDGAPVRRVS